MGLGIDYRLMYRAQGLVSASNFAASIQRWVEALGREPEPGELGPLAQRGAGEQVRLVRFHRQKKFVVGRHPTSIIA